MSYTKTTTHLKLAARRLDHPLIIMAIVFGVVLLASLIAAIGRHSAPAAAAAVPTPQLPIIMIATAPAATPAAQSRTAQPRYVVAFDAPSGNVLGPIPLPDSAALLVVRTDGWAMIEWDGGPTWLRTAELGFSVANVSPARLVVVSAPAQSQQPDQQQEQLDQAAPAPQATPIPTDVPIVPITPQNLPVGQLGGPGSSSGGSW